jgi:uncharacterized iron-regulated protein
MTKEESEEFAAFFMLFGIATQIVGVLIQALEYHHATWDLITKPNAAIAYNLIGPPIEAGLVFVAVGIGSLIYGAIFGKPNGSDQPANAG